ncbi:MAG: lipoate--protein ligase [Ignavibacteriaceae bacterium]|jgi:lipoate-protein ligase A|nr:lipoate--protein ligase [Ignavibacteriaceae bacterium]
MNFLISSSLDPYWNLATEEHLLKNSSEDYLFLYVNKPCVVVGKHQIAQKEVNSPFILANNILVARRLSGGGAVYHDEGNLNFSYIQSVAISESISYKKITESIFTFLKHLVPELSLSERNDFILEGKKISGSAMHIYKNRVLAHGTLLIDCNITNLSLSLKANLDRYTDKSIASKKSTVMNLCEASKKINIDYILANLQDFFVQENRKLDSCLLPESSIIPIRNLIQTKYSTEEWIFDYSPRYIYQHHVVFNNSKISYKLEVTKGIIEEVSIESEDSISNNILLEIKRLQGQKHNIYAIKKLFTSQKSRDFNNILFASLF